MARYMCDLSDTSNTWHVHFPACESGGALHVHALFVLQCGLESRVLWDKLSVDKSETRTQDLTRYSCRPACTSRGATTCTRTDVRLYMFCSRSLNFGRAGTERSKSKDPRPGFTMQFFTVLKAGFAPLWSIYLQFVFFTSYVCLFICPPRSHRSTKGTSPASTPSTAIATPSQSSIGTYINTLLGHAVKKVVKAVSDCSMAQSGGHKHCCDCPFDAP
jgi:hypothetical protein